MTEISVTLKSGTATASKSEGLTQSHSFLSYNLRPLTGLSLQHALKYIFDFMFQFQRPGSSDGIGGGGEKSIAFRPSVWRSFHNFLRLNRDTRLFSSTHQMRVAA